MAAMKAPASLRPNQSVVKAPPAAVTDLLALKPALAIAACLLAVVCAVYARSLNFQFILDDHRFTNDPRIQMPDHVWEYFSNFVWAQFTGGPPSFYRPVFLLWMRINFIFCALSPWEWHFLSIAKHVVVSSLLGFLVWQLLRDRVAALLAAGLFALHPAQTESVAWVTVPDPLMAAALLASLLCFWKFLAFAFSRDQALDRKSRRRKKADAVQSGAGWWLVLSAVFYAAALLAKETAIVFPVLIFLLAFFFPMRPESSSDVPANFALRARHALLHSTSFLAVTAVYLLMRWNALEGKLGAATQHLSWTTIVLSWPAILWFYLKAIFWPLHSYAFADGDLAVQFSLHRVLLPGIAVACLGAALFAMMAWCWKKTGTEFSSRRTVGIRFGLLAGVLLLVLPILPALNVNALNPGDFLHGRYTYLPLAGLMMVLAAAWHFAGEARIPLAGLAIAIMIVFGALTFSQENMWRDDLTVFTTANALAPHNAPVARNLADAQVQQALQFEDEGRCNDAVPVFQRVAKDYPEDWYAWAALGVCQVQLNDLPNAEASLRHAAEISHDARVTEQWRQLRANMGLPDLSPPK
ncbi:MAG TPA: tetratricopeptide repeat protein [Candidatus Sulfotelmatobacter sp.]|jgi:hypothetical protein